MADINEMRKRFYEADDADPYSLGSSSSSTAAAATASSSSLAGPARPPRRTSGSAVNSSSSSAVNAASSSAAAAAAGGRPGPYPKRPSGGARAKRKDPAGLSFVERARAAPDDDDDYIHGGTGAGAMAMAMAMDVDIDTHAAGAGAGTDARREREASESDVAKLLRAWQDERHAPDILPSADALLVRVLDAIRRQSEDASALRSAAHMSEEEHYMTMLVQTEVERTKFVVRSYVRTRLFKIEQYAAHITSQPSLQSRLTAAELRHAQRYAALTVSQFTHTVLSHLPEAQQALDDEVITIPNMITEPNKDKPVFCHTFDTLPSLMLRDGSTIEVARDAVVMVPYRSIEQLLLRGEVELV